MFFSQGPGDSTRYLTSNFPSQVAFQLFSVTVSNTYKQYQDGGNEIQNLITEIAEMRD